MINLFPFTAGIRFISGCLHVGGILLFVSKSGWSQEVDDIRDIMIERPPDSIVPVILWIALITAILVFSFFTLRKFLRRKVVVTGPPPEAIAINRLREISSQVDEMAPNKASLETSEAVKDFLTAQYEDPIRYETAEEYLTRISVAVEGEGAKLPPTLTEEVRSFMSISQELKFAQLREAKSRIPSLIQQAEAIIGMAIRERGGKKRR